MQNKGATINKSIAAAIFSALMIQGWFYNSFFLGLFWAIVLVCWILFVN